jgi:hypothetical protein
MRGILIIFAITFVFIGCQTRNLNHAFPTATGNDTLTGTRFFQLAKSYNWQQRDSLAMVYFKAGAVPHWWKRFTKVSVKSADSNGKVHQLHYWVSPDYFAVGTNDDWVRVPITPMAAQTMMDVIDCIFPTRKMVDQIHMAAKLKLAPVPMYAFRDSGITMYQHHLIVEGQRKLRKGLISGIKKDVVTTYKLQYGPKTNRVAIYGWHQPNGKPIQPLYTGHVNWYVDYSHGIRFVYNRVRSDNKNALMTQLLADPQWAKMLCDEDTCGYYRYVQ